MYELLDKPAAIREVQGYLYTISTQVNDKIPRVSIDGIYGEETRDAVLSFQIEYGIPVTGTVNLETFNALVAVSGDVYIDDALPEYIISRKSLPLRRGDQSDDVLSANLMIIELSKAYREIGWVERSTYFSSATERAVKNLQRIFRASETGVLDSRTYDRMKKEISAVHSRAEIYG